MPIFGFGFGFDVVINIIINRGFSAGFPIPGLFAPLLLLLLVPLVATTHEIPNQIFIYFPNRLSPSRLPVRSHSSASSCFVSHGLSHNQMPSEPSRAEPAGSLVGRPTSLKLENIPPPWNVVVYSQLPFVREDVAILAASLCLSPSVCVCVCVCMDGKSNKI